jgi:hypothetical protein
MLTAAFGWAVAACPRWFIPPERLPNDRTIFLPAVLLDSGVNGQQYPAGKRFAGVGGVIQMWILQPAQHAGRGMAGFVPLMLAVG